jgi:hypothetical protein
MNILLRVPLNTAPEQSARLSALQAVFAQACNALAPVVQQTRVWNRVALHHLMYRTLRERFPELGSQMVCNAIYSVSRTSRLVFQSPQSPFNLAKLAGKPLPLLRFTEQCPVYFDRHTLSVKDGQLSMYTLDGRMRFALALSPQDEANFRVYKLLEIVLSGSDASNYSLAFQFSDTSAPTTALDESQPQAEAEPAPPSTGTALPDYVLVEETP